MGTQKIISVLIILVALGGTGYVLAGHTFVGNRGSSSVAVLQPPPSTMTVRTPAWYEAHRDVLQADNQRCAQEGKNLPPALCANVATADKEISSRDAMGALNQASGASGR